MIYIVNVDNMIHTGAYRGGYILSNKNHYIWDSNTLSVTEITYHNLFKAVKMNLVENAYIVDGNSIYIVSPKDYRTNKTLDISYYRDLAICGEIAFRDGIIEVNGKSHNIIGNIASNLLTIWVNDFRISLTHDLTIPIPRASSCIFKHIYAIKRGNYVYTRTLVSFGLPSDFAKYAVVAFYFDLNTGEFKGLAPLNFKANVVDSSKKLDKDMLKILLITDNKEKY